MFHMNEFKLRRRINVDSEQYFPHDESEKLLPSESISTCRKISADLSHFDSHE